MPGSKKEEKSGNGLKKWVWIVGLTLSGITLLSILGGGLWPALGLQTEARAEKQHETMEMKWQQNVGSKLDTLLKRVPDREAK